MECVCEKCGMGVKGLICMECNAELILDTITDQNNKKINVATCPQGCGKIKSPMCCGQDMKCS